MTVTIGLPISIIETKLDQPKVNYQGVLTTKMLEDREFQFSIYICSFLSNKEFIRKQNVSRLQSLS